MCGRTCLTLAPNQIIRSCKYKTEKLKSSINKLHEPYDKEQNIETDVNSATQLCMPEWRSEFNCGRNFVTSYNIAPTDITPVIVSAEHFLDGETEDQSATRVIVPMMWGMIPFWHKGDFRKHGLTTNNCRLEHLLDSKLYRGPFQRGQRCIILCEGFYEWQTTKSAKPSERAAYFLHMPQEKEVNIYDKRTWKPENINLLKMAGIFDIWEDNNGDKMFSYSIITFASSQIMSWLHHRMPAILETEKQVDDWLDYKRVSNEQALSVLRPASQLQWYQVSNFVNSSRNKSGQCNKPISLSKMQMSANSINKTMLAWLNVRKRREEMNESTDTETSENNTQNTAKRPKNFEYKNQSSSKE